MNGTALQFWDAGSLVGCVVVHEVIGAAKAKSPYQVFVDGANLPASQS